MHYAAMDIASGERYQQQQRGKMIGSYYQSSYCV